MSSAKNYLSDLELGMSGEKAKGGVGGGGFEFSWRKKGLGQEKLM